MLRILLGFTAVGLAVGIALALPCAAPRPALEGLGSAQMSYFLANQALFSGDSDAALTHVAAVREAQVDASTLCPTVPFTLELRGGRFAFCNPDAVSMPGDVAAWVDAERAEASRLHTGGDVDGAVSHLRGVLAVNPYDLDARGQLVAWLGEGADGDLTAREAERLQAMKQGRLLSLDSLRAQRL